MLRAKQTSQYNFRITTFHIFPNFSRVFQDQSRYFSSETWAWKFSSFKFKYVPWRSLTAKFEDYYVTFSRTFPGFSRTEVSFPELWPGNFQVLNSRTSVQITSLWKKERRVKPSFNVRAGTLCLRSTSDAAGQADEIPPHTRCARISIPTHGRYDSSHTQIVS